MAALTIICIKSAPAKVSGKLQNLMLEIAPGIFVWKLSAKAAKRLWEDITKHHCSAICVFSAKTEAGFVIATHGQSKREVVSNYGIPLVKYKKH